MKYMSPVLKFHVSNVFRGRLSKKNTQEWGKCY